MQTWRGAPIGGQRNLVQEPESLDEYARDITPLLRLSIRLIQPTRFVCGKTNGRTAKMSCHSYLHLPVAVRHLQVSGDTLQVRQHAIIHCLLEYPEVSSVWSGVDGLQVAVGLHPFHAPFDAESTLLVASKGDVGHDLSMCVDPHISRLELFPYACGLLIVASPHGRT